MSLVEHIVSANNVIGEGPLWHQDEQALYWVDFKENQHIHRWSPGTGQHQVFATEIPVTALGIRASGGFIAATGKGLAFWNLSTKEFDFLSNPEAHQPHIRFNDGAVDRRGRFWAGTMNDKNEQSPDGSLYRFDPNGSVHTMEKGLTVSNGLGWSPDDRTMYFTDTFRFVIYSYDFDLASGSVTNRRPFVLTCQDDGFPDGLTVDSQGFVWSAFWGGWKVVRYDPSGKIERVIGLPVQNPTSCAFGGENLDELFITSANIGLNEQQRIEQPLAGDLFRVRTGIKGIAEAKFAG